MPKIIDLARTAYWWVEGADAIADVSKPTVAELADAINLSELTVNSTSITAAASDTTDERPVTAKGNARTPTIGNYSGQWNLFREGLATVASGATTVFAADDVETIFDSKGIEGFVIKRTGLSWREELEALQKVEVYAFVTDTPIKTGGTQDGFLKLMVPLLPTGDFDVSAVVTA